MTVARRTAFSTAPFVAECATAFFYAATRRAYHWADMLQMTSMR